MNKTTFLILLLVALAACQSSAPANPVPTATVTSSAAASTVTPQATGTTSPLAQETAIPPTETATAQLTTTPREPTCEDLERLNLTQQELQRIAPFCGPQSSFGGPAASATAEATAPGLPTPAPVQPRPTSPPLGPETLTSVVSNQIVTALYVDDSGAIYYGVAKEADGVHDPSLGDHAVWKQPPGGAPIQLTPYIYRLIGGVAVHNGTIYFNEGGQPGTNAPGVGNLRRMPDDNAEHQAGIVLHYPALSVIWAHVNHALVKYQVNGQDALLMAVGSIMDSNYDPSPRFSGIQPPWYEPFPTGRILYANFAWLDGTNNYQVTQGVAGQFDEYARGFRNPWAMTSGVIGGQMHVFAVDNDPAFTPAKKDANVTNSGDEVNDIFPAKDYGHPFAYGGNEPAFGDVPPIANFIKGSVPSGVAVAAGKLFVSLHDAAIVVKVDTVNHTWTPVLTKVEAFNLAGHGNLLYVADFGGIRVIDARVL